MRKAVKTRKNDDNLLTKNLYIMRKITSLLMLLCVFVGTAWGQVAKLDDLGNDKAYLLKNANDMGYAIWKDGNNLTLCGATSTYTDPLDETHEGSSWQILLYKDYYFLYNIGAKKFAVTTGGATFLTETPTPISIETVTKGFAFNSDGDSQHYMCAAHHLTPPVQYWTRDDNGSAWQIIESPCEIDAEIYTKVKEYVDIQSVIVAAQAAVDGASNTLVGSYTTASVQTLSEKLEAYDTDKSVENFNAVKEAYNALLENGEKVSLGEGDVFTVKCLDTNRGYMVYSTVDGKGSETQVYLAGTNKPDFHAAIDAQGVYKEWAYVEVDGKKYIFNTENKKFITSDGVVQFSEMGHAFNFVDIGNALWEIQFEANNKYLSYSPGWGADCVRTEGGVDNGCKFYIEKADQSLAAGVLTAMEDKINAAKLETWKNANLASLGYVGGYPASMADAIKSVTTYSGALTFDVENAAQRKALTEGYYYVKGTGTGNNANWYVTYTGDSNTELKAMSGEIGIQHLWKFVADGDGYKLMSCNTGKYVTALSAAPAPTQIADEGVKFSF